MKILLKKQNYFKNFKNAQINSNCPRSWQGLSLIYSEHSCIFNFNWFHLVFYVARTFRTICYEAHTLVGLIEPNLYLVDMLWISCWAHTASWADNLFKVFGFEVEPWLGFALTLGQGFGETLAAASLFIVSSWSKSSMFWLTTGSSSIFSVS